MEIIQLPTGESVKVDSDFYPMLVTIGKWCKQTSKYAATRHRGKLILMHQLVYEWRYGSLQSGFTVDHIDRDGLNNQTYNLRPATKSQQCMNRAINSNNTSGYKGAYYQKTSGRWFTQLKYEGKYYYGGCFDTPEEAHDKHMQMSKELAGEFACEG